MKKYKKVYVKKDPATGLVVIGDGDKPIMGDVTKKDIPLEDAHERILNRSWKKTGVYYAPMLPEPPEKTEGRLALEKEANDLKITFRDNIGDEKLQEKINNAKKEE